MATVSDLIHSSFRLIGAIAAGETLEANELNDAFVSLNQMIGSWNTEGLSLYGRQLGIIPTQFGVNSYPTAHIVKIDSASVQVAGIDCPLEIVDSTGWDAIDEKYMSAIKARKLYCDYRYPTSTILIWPMPRQAGALNFWSYSLLNQFATANDIIDLPPGYEMALRYNFAMAILPEYPRSQVDPTLPAQAQMYKASLAQLNAGNHARSQSGSSVQASVSNAAEAVTSR